MLRDRRPYEMASIGPSAGGYIVYGTALGMLRKAAFLWQHRYWPQMSSCLRSTYFRVRGMRIGARTYMPSVWVSWPHQVSLGRSCQLESGVRFKYDGPYKPGPSILISDRAFIGAGVEFNITERIEVGEDSLISAGVRFIDHDHATDPRILMRLQLCVGSPIVVGRDCWIGANTVILKGVHIGAGAIVGAGSVVTRCIPQGEIWAGVPARFIRRRRTGCSARNIGGN